MKFIVTMAALAAGLLAPVAASAGTSYKYAFSNPEHVIYVSCYRGPWKDVIWDRPNPVFVDSLVAVGYDFPTAHAIAERICRDRSLVSNPEGLRIEMIRIYHQAGSPAYRHHQHRPHRH